MNTNPLPRVVRVTTLQSFMAEVPASLDGDGQKSFVRLLNRRSEVEMSATLLLSLQGVNAADEIVWLCETRTISWLYGKPFGKGPESAYLGIRDLETIVRDFLESRGYEVRSGDYGLPENIKPLAADFECARWVQINQYEWKVEAVELGEPALAA